MFAMEIPSTLSIPDLILALEHNKQLCSYLQLFTKQYYFVTQTGKPLMARILNSVHG